MDTLRNENQQKYFSYCACLKFQCDVPVVLNVLTITHSHTLYHKAWSVGDRNSSVCNVRMLLSGIPFNTDGFNQNLFRLIEGIDSAKGILIARRLLVRYSWLEIAYVFGRLFTLLARDDFTVAVLKVCFRESLPYANTVKARNE